MSCARPANRFSRKSPAVAGLFSWLCPASFSLLSYSGSTRTSLLDSRAKHGNDNIFSSVILGQAQHVPGISSSWIARSTSEMTVLFFLLSSSDKRSAFRGSLDCWEFTPGHLFLDSRAKHGNDKGEEKNTGMTGKNKSTEMTILFFSYA